MQKGINILHYNAGWKTARVLLVILLLFMYCTKAIAGKGDTQNALDKKISIECKNIPLKEAVAKLGSCLTGVSFTYVESGALNGAKVNFSAKDEKASDVLEKILSPSCFSYTVIQYHVIIWYDANKAKRNGGKATGLLNIPRITGTVTNLAMDALTHVTISVLGGAKLEYSNASGGFTLNNIACAAVLVFSAKGYKPQKVYARTAAEGFLLVQLAKDGTAAQTVEPRK